MPAAAKGPHRHRPAVQRIKARFVIEGIDLAGPTVHEEEDHALGPGREMRLPGRQRIGGGAARRGSLGLVEKPVHGQQAGQGQPGEAGAGFPEKLTAGAVAKMFIHGIDRFRSFVPFEVTIYKIIINWFKFDLLLNCFPYPPFWPTTM